MDQGKYGVSFPILLRLRIRGLTACLVTIIPIFLFSPDPVAAGDWHEEFDEICVQAQTADSLSEEELLSLVERADKLLPVIKASDDPRKKVYLFRLKKCRNLFVYMLEVNRK